MSNRDRVVALMRDAQARLCAAFEALDGVARFQTKQWQRPGGGGGVARVLSDGATFERAGVNVSAVYGDHTPPALWHSHPRTKGQPFFATGISMVLHPRNPYVPAFHANFRYFESGIEGGERWFGGGMDMTPSYVFEEDAQHFHRVLRDTCARHGVDYATLKAACDAYFRHRASRRDARHRWHFLRRDRAGFVRAHIRFRIRWHRSDSERVFAHRATAQRHPFR